MSETIEVLARGTQVKVGDGIPGRVRSVTIGTEVYYTVGYWQDKNYTEAFLPAGEVTPMEPCEKTKIGFR